MTVLNTHDVQGSMVQPKATAMVSCSSVKVIWDGTLSMRLTVGSGVLQRLTWRRRFGLDRLTDMLFELLENSCTWIGQEDSPRDSE